MPIWGLGIGDWGLGIGDWAQSPIPNPQSPFSLNLYKKNKAKINLNDETNLGLKIKN